MLDVRRLRLLAEVARRGSIARAAEALSFTPSAVSQQLAKLEREAGVALLERGARSVRLTGAGEALVERAEDIMRRLDEAEAELRAYRGRNGALRISSFPSAAAPLVVPALAALRAAHGDVATAVAEADPLVSLDRLTRGEADVALLFEYDYVALPDTPELERQLLLEEPFRLVLPRGHPAARRRSVGLAELAEEPWIRSTPRSSCHPFTVRACRAAGFEPRIAFDVDDYQAMQNLVAAGAGVALAPEMALAAPHPGVEVRPIAFRAPRRRIYAAHRAADAATPLVRALVGALHAAAAPLAGIELAEGSRVESRT